MTRDAEAAKQFFQKTLQAAHTVTPRVITVDKTAAYSKALDELKAEDSVPTGCELRQITSLNNSVEQDHRFIKRLVKPGLGYFAFETAWQTLRGDELMNMMRKGQMQGVTLPPTNCSLKGRIDLSREAMQQAGIARVACPECATTRSLDPEGSQIRFPPHDKRKTRTPSREERWIRQESVWKLAGARKGEPR